MAVVSCRRRALAPTAILTAAAVTLGVVAFTHPGFTDTRLELHDGGVWVTNQSTSQVGHINMHAGELDLGMVVPSVTFDVYQSAGTVLVRDDENLRLQEVATGTASLEAEALLPAGADVSLGGGVVSILDPATGALWALPAAELPAFRADSAEPLAELGEGAVAVTDVEGRVHAASPRQARQLVVAGDADSGAFTVVEEWARPELAEASDLQITAVGREPVVLDRSDQQVLLRQGSVPVPEGASLQHAGNESDSVVLSTATALVTVPLTGGDAVERAMAERRGAVVAPVQVGGCVYGAWLGDRRLVRECDDSTNNLDATFDLPSDARVVFREHRGVVALNEMLSGTSWLLSDELIQVDNWADLIPRITEEVEDDSEEEAADDRLDNRLPEHNGPNTDPIASDDTIFGARPGRATIVPVTHNDTDADGDILAVSLVGDAPDGVVIAPVQNNTMFQVEVREQFAGSQLSFEYRVTDGRGGSDTARVTMPIRQPGENNPPQPLRRQNLDVEQRASADHLTMDAWYDPDGDDVFLVGAESAAGDTVQFNPNGRIVYTATGEVGSTTMTVTMSDGRATASDDVDVQVHERGEAAPWANNDYVAAAAGQRVNIQPLENDFVPAGAARIASVADRGGVQVRLDRATNSVSVTGEEPGTYYVDYVLAAGAFSAQATIRVDLAAPDPEAAPVAVKDMALLPAGGEALIDLTDNDVDPAGGVLVVQSVDVGGQPLSVQLVGRHLLRVQSASRVDAPVALAYEVSNGRASARGAITVVPIPPPEQPRPPVAVNDTAVLREGDFTSVAVLANDFSPDSVPFRLEPEIVSTSLNTPAEGEVFVSGNQVRIHVVEGGPEHVDVVYEIADEFGNRSTASLRVQVEPRDPATNQAPIPKPVTGRVLAGSTVRVPIPLQGTDPNGDGVSLVGLETSPDQGRIAATGPDYFDFEAFEGDSGVTSFEYRVQDRWGASSVATVTVGIAQPGIMNQPPFAALDTVSVRPGRAVAVPVLENDSDPDGDQLRLAGLVDGGASPELEQLRVPEGSESVHFTAPSAPGNYTVEYTVEDERGARAVGAVQVTVEDDAPMLPPLAADDVVDVTELTPGEPYRVAVKDNDRDPDGDPAELEVEVLTGAGTVVDDRVQVTPGDQWFVVTYRVTDQDGGKGQAFILVPSVTKRPPVLASGIELSVPSGQSLTIRLADVVQTFNGAPPRVTRPETVRATHANGDALFADEGTLQFTSEEGYAGKAAITFEVTDAVGADDPDSTVARLSIPINVTPVTNIPPRFAGAELQVEPGEGAAEFDLRSVTTDPDAGDEDQMRFELVGGGADGVTANVQGTTFRASAALGAPAGTVAVYQVRLTDSAGHEVQGTVQVRIVASARPLPQAVDDQVETDQGRAVTVNALGNDFNPFQARGESLVITQVRLVGGQVQGGPTTDGREVTVTPAGDFTGVVTLEYTVQDALRTAARESVGTIRVNVRGVPDAPPRPAVGAIESGSVTLSWAAPAANGSPISGYRVEWNGGSQSCPATTCTISGLTNGRVYNFRVVAINAVGQSAPSEASEDVRTDTRPGQPAPPTVVRGDRSLDVSWTAPRNDGSPITGYVLTISPPAGGIAQQQVSGTSYTWSGLTNGTEYTFTVQAVNGADEPSAASASSAPVAPAGLPGPVSNIQATSVPIPGTNDHEVTLTWDAPDDNGAVIFDYVVCFVEVRGGGGCAQGGEEDPGRSAQQAPTTETLVRSSSAYPYEAMITPVNAVGRGPTAYGGRIRLVSPPAAPTISFVSEGDGSVTFNLVPGSTAGFQDAEVRYQYQIDGDAWLALSATPGTVTVDAPNRQVQVRVRAVATVDGEEYPSAPSAPITARPFGPPPAPHLTTQTVDGGVLLQWEVPGENGRPIAGIRYRVSGGQWADAAGATGSVLIPAEKGAKVEIEAQSRAEGGPSESSRVTGHGPLPPMELHVTEHNTLYPYYDYTAKFTLLWAPEGQYWFSYYCIPQGEYDAWVAGGRQKGNSFKDVTAQYPGADGVSYSDELHFNSCVSGPQDPHQAPFLIFSATPVGGNGPTAWSEPVIWDNLF